MSSKVQQLNAKNSNVFARIKRGLSLAPSKALADSAAAVLSNAVLTTVHDSSRAGANWQIQFDDSSLPEWDPAEYEGQVHGMGSIGKRGSTGAFASAVVGYKAAYYGYDEATGSVEPRGRLARGAGVGRWRTPSRAFLVNPVTAVGPYAQNAFSQVSLVSAESAVAKAAPGIGSRITSMINRFVRTGKL